MKENEEIDYRDYSSELRGGVVALLSRVYGTARGFETFEVKNPLAEPLRVVALRQEKVVGFNQWNAWLLPGYEGSGPLLQSGASAVDPSCRGQGVFANLLALGDTLAAKRGVGFFIGFSNPASTNSFLRDGWRCIHRLRLHLFPSPSLGRTRPGEVELPSAFLTWRYQKKGVRTAVVDVGGEPLLVLYRMISRFGVKANKFLDVVDGRGRRRLELAHRAAFSLPGPGIAYIRVGGSRRLVTGLHISRKWDTPFIIKRICGSQDEERALEGVATCYGDIDAA